MLCKVRTWKVHVLTTFDPCIVEGDSWTPQIFFYSYHALSNATYCRVMLEFNKG